MSLTAGMRLGPYEIVARIDAGVTIPPGGIVVVSPVDRSETVVRTLPAVVQLGRD